jgi:hypothetical protein
MMTRGADAKQQMSCLQDGHTVYHAFALHKDPLRCPVSHLIQYILFSLRVNACPIIEMITGSDLRWRSLRL